MLSPRAEDGFTLLELLAAMVIGMVVLFGAFAVIDGAFRVNADVSGRSEATARGRAAMDEITRALRSEICATGTSRVLSAGPAQVTFTTDLSDRNAAPFPEKRQLTYDPVAHTITQTVWKSVSGSPPNVVFSASPKTTVLVTDTDADPATTPAGSVFGYQAVTPNTDGRSFSSLGSTVGVGDLGRIARINVAFVTRPARAKVGDKRGVSLADSVLVRSLFADNNDQRYACQ